MTSYRPKRRRAKRTCSLILLRTLCLRRKLLITTTSPNQQGGEGLDSEVVWIFTTLSAILVISPSLLRIASFFLFKVLRGNWLKEQRSNGADPAQLVAHPPCLKKCKRGKPRPHWLKDKDG